NHRHAVLLTKVFPEAILTEVNGEPVRTPDTLVTDPLSGVGVVQIELVSGDALPFPLCISGEGEQGFVDDISVALGNIVLADHGMTYTDVPPVAFDLELVETSLWPDTVPTSNPALE